MIAEFVLPTRCGDCGVELMALGAAHKPGCCVVAFVEECLTPRLSPERRRENTLAWAQQFEDEANELERKGCPVGLDAGLYQACIDSGREIAKDLREEAG